MVTTDGTTFWATEEAVQAAGLKSGVDQTACAISAPTTPPTKAPTATHRHRPRGQRARVGCCAPVSSPSVRDTASTVCPRPGAVQGLAPGAGPAVPAAVLLGLRRLGAARGTPSGQRKGPVKGSNGGGRAWSTK